MSLGIVVCSNGLGHLRRVLLVLSYMVSNGYAERIDLFGSTQYLKVLSSRFLEVKNLIESPQVKCIDFLVPNTFVGTKPAQLSGLDQLNWHGSYDFLLQNYDTVWSDNLLGVLHSRPDAKLTGSFFWHEVFETRTKDNKELQKFVTQEKKLLARFRPKMAGSSYFSTPDVRNKTNFTPVGLYRTGLSTNKKENGDGVLFSCGLGGEEEELSRTALEKILRNGLRPPRNLFVEPKILPKVYPNWIIPANFSYNMFNECIAACIRPGLGTVSDALINNIKIFGFADKGSFEMAHNGKVLEQLGVGEFCNDPYLMLTKAFTYAADKGAQDINFEITSILNKNAVQTTSEFIIN